MHVRWRTPKTQACFVFQTLRFCFKYMTCAYIHQVDQSPQEHNSTMPCYADGLALCNSMITNLWCALVGGEESIATIDTYEKHDFEYDFYPLLAQSWQREESLRLCPQKGWYAMHTKRAPVHIHTVDLQMLKHTVKCNWNTPTHNYKHQQKFLSRILSLSSNTPHFVYSSFLPVLASSIYLNAGLSAREVRKIQVWVCVCVGVYVYKRVGGCVWMRSYSGAGSLTDGMCVSAHIFESFSLLLTFCLCFPFLFLSLCMVWERLAFF